MHFGINNGYLLLESAFLVYTHYLSVMNEKQLCARRENGKFNAESRECLSLCQLSSVTLTLIQGSKRKSFLPALNPNSRLPPGSTRPEDLFTNEELKSARLIATQGPFVDAKTGELLAEYYKVYSPDKDEEHIMKIVSSGMEMSLLNQKLRDKYGVDLDDFVLSRGGDLK